jgi:uncharacterized protein (DUF305 family)
MLSSVSPSVAAQDIPVACAQIGTPEASQPAATPESSAIADIDLAYLELQGILGNSSIELAELATTSLEHNELKEFAEVEIAEAESEQATLGTLRQDLYPDAEVDLNQLLAIIEQAKMDLDLPAGEGGLESFGSVVGLGQMCLSDGPHDEIYLASAIDLSRQKIDLAQVAAINSTNADIVEFATELITRETAEIGQLVTWQNEWAEGVATPAG